MQRQLRDPLWREFALTAKKDERHRGPSTMEGRKKEMCATYMGVRLQISVSCTWGHGRGLKMGFDRKKTRGARIGEKIGQQGTLGWRVN